SHCDEKLWELGDYAERSFEVSASDVELLSLMIDLSEQRMTIAFNSLYVLLNPLEIIFLYLLILVLVVLEKLKIISEPRRDHVTIPFDLPTPATAFWQR